MNGILRHNRKAFTLLEMVLATAIAVIVLTGALAVLGLLARDRLRADHVRGRIVAHEFPAILRSNLINSRQIQLSETGKSVNLIGYGALSSQSGERLTPVNLTYQIVDAGGTKALIRRQQRLDDSRGAAAETEYVSFDIVKLTLKNPKRESSDIAGKFSFNGNVSVSLEWTDGTSSQTTARQY